MGPRMFLMVLSLCLLPLAVQADDRLVRLHAPDALIDSGALQYILPRFSLKTQVRVELVAAGDAHIALGDSGRALFQGLGQVWRMEVIDTGHPGTQRLADWLTGDIGQRTIQSFAPDGTALFAPPADTEPEVVELEMTGDPALGHRVSRAKCTRCHAVDTETRWSGIGSTPSFAVLRSLPDWMERFSAFYALNPHPSFVIIADVTEPFPIDRPPPIVPVEMTLDEVEALLAYVEAMAPADLGKPLVHQ